MPSHVLNTGVIGRAARTDLPVGLADQSVTLTPGRYELIATLDCYYRIGAAATVAAGTVLLARVPTPVYIPAATPDLHSIVGAGAGTIYCHPVEG